MMMNVDQGTVVIFREPIPLQVFLPFVGLERAEQDPALTLVLPDEPDRPVADSTLAVDKQYGEILLFDHSCIQ